MDNHMYPNISSSVSGDVLFIEDGTPTRNCAFCVGSEITFRVFIPRLLAANKVCLEITDNNEKTISNLILNIVDFSETADIYQCDLSEISIGLYFAKVRISTYLFGEFFLSFGDDGKYPITKGCSQNNIQFSFSDFSYEEPKGLSGGIIYHIFVDRFFKSGRAVYNENCILNEDWEDGIPQIPEYPGAPLKNNMFFGGTLDGIREKLPFLKKLGVSAIYLSPIFESVSNHKYDTGDYMKIDEMFGGEAAFKDLLTEACQSGIGIILDGVFNHTGDDSKYFNKYGKYPEIGAYQSKDSPFYSWYRFDHFPDKYTCWWDIPILPRIHPDEPSCRSYFTGTGGVIEKYANMGILGFRLDVVDELSDAFISEIKKALNRQNSGSVLYGEVWEDASNKIAYGTRKQYYLGRELDGVMNYPLRSGLISYFIEGKTDDLLYALKSIIRHAPKRIRNLQMNFLGTHDTPRILTLLGGGKSDGFTPAELATKKLPSANRKIGEKRVRAAYTVLATLPGVPSVFYGDEAGMEGYSDPLNRMPYPWGKEDKTILRHFEKIGKLRRENDVYGDGDFHLLSLTSDLLIFARTKKENAFVTVYNRSEGNCKIFFSQATDLLAKKEITEDIIKPLEAKIYKTSINHIIAYSL